MFDSRMSVVLPEEKADEFIDLFYPNNMDGFNVEEREEHDSYTNSHGLALRNIGFQPRTGLLYDLVYGLGTREMSLKAVCQKYGVKRLTMYRLDTDSGYEESVTYDKKNGVTYQDRNAFPLPENEYLDEEETIDDKEVEAE